QAATSVANSGHLSAAICCTRSTSGSREARGAAASYRTVASATEEPDAFRASATSAATVRRRHKGSKPSSRRMSLRAATSDSVPARERAAHDQRVFARPGGGRWVIADAAGYRHEAFPCIERDRRNSRHPNFEAALL